MAQDYYGSDAAQPAGEPAPEAEAKTEESNVAILPKAFFPPDKELKPGNTCKVRVEEVQGDQVLVTYSHDEAAEESDAAPAAPTMDEEMAGYMS